MLARRFLYLVAILIVLVLCAAIAWNLFQPQIVRAAFVPSGPWSAPSGPAPDYRRADAWIARPDLPRNPARWKAPATPGAVSVFYVMPTTALDKDMWNAALAADEEVSLRQRLFTQTQASAFNAVGQIWAPRYRQAVLGAFLTPDPSGAKALDFAYRDVAAAFDAFLAQLPADTPILLAGHSQGSFHLMRLMREKVAGKPIARRIVAAYLVGWPISTGRDIPRLGLPACRVASDSNCIISWQSFAEPAEPEQSFSLYGGGVDTRDMLCVNPLTGAADQRPAPASANVGAIRADAQFEPTGIEPGLIPARCSAQSLLLIGAPPKGYDGFVFPGNNYHVYDYALFWGNLRQDAARRARSFAPKDLSQ